METTKLVLNTVPELYSYLELLYQTKFDTYTFFSRFSSDNDDVLRKIGYNRFLLNEHFETSWSPASLDKPTIDELVSYSYNRLSETNNPHLLVRYNTALLVMHQDNRFALKAIDAYWQVADTYLKESLNNYEFGYEFLQAMKDLLNLCVKYKKDEITNITAYLYSILSQNYSIHLKVGILNIFLNDKVFKLDAIKGLPQFCLSLSDAIEPIQNKERVSEIGLKLSQRLNNQEMIVKFAELLGDLALNDIQEYDDSNIAISHMNEVIYEKAISYYKIAKNGKKQSETIIKLEQNRTHHQYIKFPIYVKSDNQSDYIDAINRLVEITIDKPLSEILFSLCKHNHSSLLIDYNHLATSAYNNREDTNITSCFEAVRVDKWGNKHPTTHEAVRIHDSFHIMYQRSTLLYIPLLLCNCMNFKKMTTSQFRAVIKKTGLFVPISVKRSGGTVEIPLYDIVGKGLEDFVKQNNISFKNRSKADWRFCIDFLTPKFEFIVRCIASTLNVPVVKTLRDGTVQFITLEKILSDSKLKIVFNDDDIFLFNHTFTKDGLNVRNDVAHGLMLPQDYTKEVALLVFLCILRLSKIADYIVSLKENSVEK